MTLPRVAAFFYGSFIRMDILALGGLKPEKFEVARLSGFDIHIGPHASISRSDRHCVYGIVVQATHEELGRLYSMDWVGTFLPEAVLVETRDGKLEPALCYISPPQEKGPPDREYQARLVAAASEYGFPKWYIDRLESFQ